ncbi:MAG: CopC domain [Actinomycetota bacterium]|jgi:methionine-rich copper-binding protein CopC|nr:CopC domain [Actinomycetota bacterium]
MRRRFGSVLVASLAFALIGGAAVAGPTSPMLLQSDPADGAKLSTAPDQMTLTFSQPLDAHYSRVEIYACGKRVNPTTVTVTASQMTTAINKHPRGTYKVFYFANGTPKGATGETAGSLTFTVKKGPSCK